jgi:5-methylcytosine-specific restriction enzyme B
MSRLDGQNLGDLSRFDELNRTEIKKQITPLLQENYPNTPQVIGKWSTQIAIFLKKMKKGTIVVAAEGEKVLRIGKVIGGYEFKEGKDFPHTIKTECGKRCSSGFSFRN